jgi:serine/threonine protein kinase
MSLCINPKCPQPENSDQLLFCQNCGSQLLLAGQYRVTKLMSKKGGFADTYEIVERGTPKVLKVLKSTNAKALELFEREFRVLNSLTGEGIAGIPQVEELFSYSPRDSQQNLDCLVMERIYGMDLEEYVKAMKRSIDEKTAVGWLSQLTQILQEIHSRGIFHRDIKHSNIILQPDGQLVLIDFGAVKEAAANILGQATVIYTPGYAAPEQQQSGQSSVQSDFFALGRTFVYLLTTKEPAELYSSHQNLFAWRDKTSNISTNFLDLIDRLMQIDPRERPDSTATIFREIAALPPINTRQGASYLPPQSLPQTETVLSITQLKQKIPLFKYLIPAAAVLAAFGVGWWLSKLKVPGSGDSPQLTGETFAQVKDVPSGNFKFGGSTTWATTRRLESSIDAAIKGVSPNYDIVYTDASSPDVRSARDGKCDKKPGSNAGICWLIEGDLDFAQSSVALDKSKYADLVAANRLKEQAVAYDALSVVVNPKLQISGLTVAQLRDIYTGKVTNWSEVGGPNLPILALSRAETAGGTVSSFKDLVLKKGDSWKFKQVTNTTEGLQQVKTNLGGIYYGAGKEVIVDFCDTKPLPIGKTADSLVKPYQEPLQSPEACGRGQRNKLNTEVIKNQEYPLTRKIYVIIKADGTDRQKAGEAYANLLKTKQGQNLLEKAGFVSINN